jgi:transposase
MGLTSRRHWRKNLSDPTRPIGGKHGTKQHILVDENGVPLSLVVSGANRHDSVFLDALLKNSVVAPGQKATPHNRCLDAAYVGKDDTVISNGFITHIQPRGEEKKLIEKDPSFKARRWAVELAHSWFNWFRKLIPRYEKTDLSYIALNTLAAAMIVLNKIMAIYR